MMRTAHLRIAQCVRIEQNRRCVARFSGQPQGVVSLEGPPQIGIGDLEARSEGNFLMATSVRTKYADKIFNPAAVAAAIDEVAFQGHRQYRVVQELPFDLSETDAAHALEDWLDQEQFHYIWRPTFLRVAFLGGHLLPGFAAGQRAGEPGEGLVAALGIGVAEPVGVSEACLVGLVLIAFELLDIGELGRDQRALPLDEGGDVLQRVALLQRGDGHCSRAATFGPAALECDLVSAHGDLRPELDRFLTAQAEGDLQQERGLDVRAFDGLEFCRVEGLGAVARDLAALGHAIGGVVAADHVRLADFLGPPAQPAQSL